MAHRKWKETKQRPSMLPGPAVPGSCLVSFHILWAILSTSTVQLFFNYMTTLMVGIIPSTGYIHTVQNWKTVICCILTVFLQIYPPKTPLNVTNTLRAFEKELSYNNSYFQMRNLGTSVTSVAVTAIKNWVKKECGSRYSSKIMSNLRNFVTSFLFPHLYSKLAVEQCHCNEVPCGAL